MKRKEFIGKSVSAGILPVIINGFSVKAFADSPLAAFLNKAGNEDRVLVLIQLNGGNDGLNTVLPIDQYSKLSNARSNILIPESKILSLTNTVSTGLHPSMTHLRNLYNNGQVSIIQAVGYPNQDFSHFRSTDIWLTGTDSNQYEDTGWMGRYLDKKYPDYPNGYPNTANPDPPAIQIGALISPALQGADASFGMSITNPDSFYNFVNGTVDPAPNTPMGHELTFVRLVAQQTQQYSGSVKAAAGKASNKSTLYPTAGSNSLADQLKIVARLVAGGLKTRVYMVSLGGFDTHSAQVGTGGTDTGNHANLLDKVSVAVNAFQDDIKLLGIEDRVLGMTFSEFGRRIVSNASLGTDHGAAAPLFIFGKKVVGGIIGTNPIIPDNPSPGDNIAMQTDFRSVYATILKNWFEVSDADLKELLYKDFPILGFLPGTTSGIISNERESSFNLYPNPASSYSTIQFIGSDSITRIRLFNIQGKEMQAPIESNGRHGLQEVNMPLEHLPEGIYLVKIQSGNWEGQKRLVISR